MRIHAPLLDAPGYSVCAFNHYLAALAALSGHRGCVPPPSTPCSFHNNILLTSDNVIRLALRGSCSDSQLSERGLSAQIGDVQPFVQVGPVQIVPCALDIDVGELCRVSQCDG